MSQNFQKALRALAVTAATAGIVLSTVTTAQATTPHNATPHQAPNSAQPFDSTLRGSANFHNCYADMYSEVNSVGHLVVQGRFQLGVSDRGPLCQAYLRRNGIQISGTHSGYPIDQSTAWYYDGAPNTAEVCVGDFISTSSYSCSVPGDQNILPDAQRTAPSKAGRSPGFWSARATTLTSFLIPRPGRGMR